MGFFSKRKRSLFVRSKEVKFNECLETTKTGQTNIAPDDDSSVQINDPRSTSVERSARRSRQMEEFPSGEGAGEVSSQVVGARLTGDQRIAAREQSTPRGRLYQTSKRQRLNDQVSTLEDSLGSTHHDTVMASSCVLSTYSQQSPHVTPKQFKAISTYDSSVAVSYKYTSCFYRRRRRFSIHTSFRRRQQLGRVNYLANRDAIREKVRSQYRNNPEFLQKVLLAVRQRYMLSPRYRRRRKTKRCSLTSDPLRCSKCKVGRRHSDRLRYATNLRDRQRRMKRSVVATLQRYYENSPYRKATIQRTGLSIKRKYRRIRLFRRNAIDKASDRYKRIMKSSSKKCVLRLQQRGLYHSSCGSRRARRRILYDDKKRKSKLVAQIVAYQATSRNYKMKKKLLNKSRRAGLRGRSLSQKKSLALLMLSRRKRDLSDDLYVHRLQFPVTVAYAITIHKCQGLSLDTAMVDIGFNVFSNGMGYVALSRIRTLNNLHLMRFSPGILKADTRCILEYNRLRRKTGTADTISHYNKNPEMEVWKSKVSVSVDDQKQQLLEELDIQAKSKGGGFQKTAPAQRVARAKKNAHVIVPAAGSVRVFLPFSNPDSHSCFANAAVQCMLRCFESAPPIVQDLQDSQVGKALGELLEEHISQSSSPVSTNDLRDSFGGQSQYATIGLNIDCDPCEFLMDLIPKLPDAWSERFQFTLEKTGKCRNCNGMKIETNPGPSVMLMGSLENAREHRFKEIFSNQVRYPARCDLCQVLDESFVFNANVLFEPANRYLLLNCPVQMEHELLPMGKLLSGLKPDGNCLYGQRWSVIATIQVNAWVEDERVLRHYIAFVRTSGNVWVRLNDSASYILKRRQPFKDMVLYVLERELG